MSLFSTTIKVPISTLQTSAEKLTSYSTENSDIFDKIYNSLRCLEGSNEWKGASLTAAADATWNNKKKFEDAVNEMEQLAKFLSDFVTEMAEEDAKISKQINSI